jgi:hypothetical protein
VFDAEQKQRIVRELTEAMVAIEGEKGRRPWSHPGRSRPDRAWHGCVAVVVG